MAGERGDRDRAHLAFNQPEQRQSLHQKRSGGGRIIAGCGGGFRDLLLHLFQLPAQPGQLRLFRPEPRRQPRQGDVNAIEKIVFLAGRRRVGVAGRAGHSRKDGLKQFVAAEMRSRLQLKRARALGQLMAQPCHGKLRVGHAQHGIDGASVEANVIILALADVIHIKLFYLPGKQSFTYLPGKTVGVGGGQKSFGRKNSRSLVVSVTIAGGTLETANHDVGPKGADDADHILQGEFVAAPLNETLLGIFGIAEIGNPGKPLLCPVVTVGGQQFECPQNAELVKKIAAYLILAAFAPGEGEKHHAGAASMRFQHQHSAILIIRMRGGMQQTRGGAQLQ